VRIDSAAVGDPGGRGAQLAAELARGSGGRSAMLRDPREFVAALEGLEWVSVASLELENRTSGLPAMASALEGDGRFTALLPLVAGENWLAIRVRASDGRRSERLLRVLSAPDAPAAPLDPHWLAARRRLLEGKRDELRRRAAALEARRAARMSAAGDSAGAAGRRALSVTVRGQPSAADSAVPASRAPAP
jgi:hypothetical protein